MNKILGVILSFAGLLAIAAVDYFTGRQISLLVLYLLPVILSTWAVGLEAGLVFGFLAASGWMFCDLGAGFHYSHITIPAWNALTALGLFVLMATLVNAARKSMDQEKLLDKTDPLTKVANSRYFYELAEGEMRRAFRSRQPLSMAYIDIDNLKGINDLFGFVQGDRLLKLFAEDIRNHIRSSDILARLGGDEFVIMLPETGVDQAKGAAAKIHKAFQALAQVHQWTPPGRLDW